MPQSAHCTAYLAKNISFFCSVDVHSVRVGSSFLFFNDVDGQAKFLCQYYAVQCNENATGVTCDTKPQAKKYAICLLVPNMAHNACVLSAYNATRKNPATPPVSRVSSFAVCVVDAYGPRYWPVFCLHKNVHLLLVVHTQNQTNFSGWILVVVGELAALRTVHGCILLATTISYQNKSEKKYVNSSDYPFCACLCVCAVAVRCFVNLNK